MSIFSIFTLLGGLAFFIYGMNQMSQSLEKIAGPKMGDIINSMTRNRFMGLIMGCGITIAIQSSSAVTVMLVGLVNSGLMEISNTVAVIMGSNIGTTITAWIMSLIGLSSSNIFIRMLKPESFSPVLAFIGIGLIMIAKRQKKRDLGNAFLGFSILMYGMTLMSSAVSPLADSPAFSKMLVAFNNPLLGILTGLIVTAVIQSSAASVGMLQALSLSGGITYGMAIPIIMGQNIGTCATALLSSIGVGKNAKKVSIIHLSFNLIGTAIFALLFYVMHIIFDFAFTANSITPAGIALCHSIFNIATTLLLLPFTDKLVRISDAVIKDEHATPVAFLDERLFATPTLAVAECDKLSYEMAGKARDSVIYAIQNIRDYSDDLSEKIKKLESEVDIYEDHLGTYLVQLAQTSLSQEDSRKTSRILHSIGNFERISDHALNLVDSAKEISDKSIDLSEQALNELSTLEDALGEIVKLAIESYKNIDILLATKVEPLEQVIDLLTATIKSNHIERLQRGECTIEKGFILADLLNNFERISDHCSNIAIAVIESDSDQFDPHEYLKNTRSTDNKQFSDNFDSYRKKYSIISEPPA